MTIKTDDELDAAIAKVDELLKFVGTNETDGLTEEQAKSLDELSNAIEEYEDRTDILNRDYRII